MPKLRAIADALNAYPWTRGRLIAWAADEPAYCALGSMLRAAGISPTEITRADSEPAHPFWDKWGPLFYAEWSMGSRPCSPRTESSRSTTPPGHGPRLPGSSSPAFLRPAPWTSCYRGASSRAS